MRIRMLPVKERFPLKRKVMTVIERRYALGVMKKKTSVAAELQRQKLSDLSY